MCGITGIFDTRGRRDIDRAVLTRMNESQHHRGPVEGGVHIEPGVGLGHRRLSIIDLATGQQPLYNEDQSVCVVFNGEIYNYQELIPELQALGHVFHTRSDTEVIVHAWEAWGERCVDRFRGMFAFALWDRNRETLFLARDRLGVKPLFYALLDDGSFIWVGLYEPADAILEKLQEEFCLHDLAVEDAQNAHQRMPHMARTEQGHALRGLRHQGPQTLGIAGLEPFEVQLQRTAATLAQTGAKRIPLDMLAQG